MELDDELNEEKKTPFLNLLWKQQQRYVLQDSVQYHPMIICFALSLAMKSANAYDKLRNSKTLILSSKRTLCDYKNAFKPSAGFNPQVVTELAKKCKDLSGIERYVVLSFDEIKI